MHRKAGTKKAHPLHVEDERITRGTTSIQHARKHTLIRVQIILYRDNGRTRRCLLSEAVQHAALGRNSEGLRCRLTPYPARCEGKLISYWFPVVAFEKNISHTFGCVKNFFSDFSELLARRSKPYYNLTIDRKERKP